MVVNLQMLFTTRALLSTLIETQPALILNVTGLPRPGIAVYSGGKAYLDGFSRILAIELELVREPPANIECLTVDVHNVATNSNGSAVGFFVLTGKAIVGVVGCGRRRVTAYWRAELVS